MLKFITVPNPILRKPSNKIKKIDDQVLKLIGELKKSLIEAQDPPGVGLSAVQIGKPQRIFVARKDIHSRPKVFINPEIIWRSKELTDGIPGRKNKLEGCLSVPGYYGLIRRPKKIKLRWQTERGQEESTKFEGFSATVIQHEIDHLDGILFVDRVLEQGNKIYKLENDKLVATSL